MPKDWWKKLEGVDIRIMGQQGFILNRYTVYQITSDVSLKFLLMITILVNSLSTNLSEAHQSPDGTQSSYFCGIVSCGGTHSGSFLLYLPKGYNVSIFLLLRDNVFMIIAADGLFLEQRRFV